MPSIASVRPDPVLRWALPAFVLVEAVVVGLAWWASSVRLLAWLEVMVLPLFGVVVILVQYTTLRRRFAREREAASRTADRRRAADEVHDLVGHELSLIALRAGLLELRSDGETAAAAADLRDHAERAVVSLHDAVSLLDGSTSAEPVTDDLESIVTRAREAGSRVTLHGEFVGPGAELISAPTRLAVVAVVREGITNAARHAPGSPVAVTIRVGADDRAGTGVGAGAGRVVDVRVVTSVAAGEPGADGDALRESGPFGDSGAHGARGGHGIESLRRRTAALGGTVEVTPAKARDSPGGVSATRRSGSGRQEIEPSVHVLAARIPVRPPPEPASDGHLPGPGARPARVLVRQAAVPTLVACAVVAGFHLWASHDATVEPAVLAGMSVGMSADEAEDLLPGREAPLGLVRTPAPPDGSACHRYTDGNFPLAAATVEICTDARVVTRITDLSRVPLW